MRLPIEFLVTVVIPTATATAFTFSCKAVRGDIVHEEGKAEFFALQGARAYFFGVKEVPRKLATTLTHRKPFLCALLRVALPTRYARVEGTTVRLDVVRFTAVHALVSLLTSGWFHLR